VKPTNTRPPKALIYPSLLAANFAKLGEEIDLVEKAGASGIHFDVMDGHFVPNLSFGAPVLECIRKNIRTEADCHLMVSEPEHLFEAFAKAGADRITIHFEACKDPKRALQRIASLGLKAGISIKPKTGIDKIFDLLSYVDLVLIMTVEPGFGGQKLIPETLSKTLELRKYLSSKKLSESVLIQVDGGIDQNTAQKAVDAGADILVAGSYVFKSSNYAQAIGAISHSLPKFGE
jgi:ribulose-phosphate 3-epimerase